MGESVTDTGQAGDTGAFPFLTSAELAAAGERWRGGAATAGAGTRLLEDAERIATAPALRDPLGGRTPANLFVIQSLLFGASLAHRLTGRDRFAEPVRRVLRDLTDPDRRPARLPSEVHLGFVMSGVGVAAALCGPAVDPELVRDLARAIGSDLADSARHAPWGKQEPRRVAWNHSAVGYAGLGTAGLLCHDEDRGQEWTAQALDRLRGFFAEGVTEAGMTREGLHYAGFVFRTAAPFLLACRNLGLFDYRDPAANPQLDRLRRVPTWFAAEVMPTGSWLRNRNDSDWDPRRAMGGFLPLFGPLDPGTVAWVYEVLLGEGGRGDHGQDRALVASALFESVLWPPGPPPTDFAPPALFADPDTGHLSERSGAGRPSGFSVACGRFASGLHGQADVGSVLFDAYGVPVLLDSGAANDPSEGSRSSSRAHNLVLVDGRGQLPSGRGRGVSGTVVHAHRGAVATGVTCDLAEAYGAAGYNPVKHALRHCLYVREPFPYLLVVDDLARADGAPATFDQLFQLPPATGVLRERERLRLDVEFGSAAGRVTLWPLDACTVHEEPRRTRAHPCPEHTTWILRRRGRGGVMATLVLPEPGAGDTLDVRAHLDRDAGTVTVRLEGAGTVHTDRFAFAPGRASRVEITRDGHRLDAQSLHLAPQQPSPVPRRLSAPRRPTVPRWHPRRVLAGLWRRVRRRLRSGR